MQRGSRELTVLTGCQSISPSGSVPGSEARGTQSSAGCQNRARRDRVTIVKNAAKEQWLHSACFNFTHSASNIQKHAELNLVYFTKLTYITTSVIPWCSHVVCYSMSEQHFHKAGNQYVM